jgi:GT2 family glycosyltransferase
VSQIASRRDPRVAVVIIVLNGRDRIRTTLDRLSTLPEGPEIVVVDNGSTDGTPNAIRVRFPQIRIIELARNAGAAGRNSGVRAVSAPYVAFAEDDSWYEPGALRTAADLLDAHPDVALINAHVRVGEDGRPDPLHADMVGTAVPERRPRLPGHRILSFLEGVSIVRRQAFLGVGGFDPRLMIGGPEEHLAADLLAAGWELRYVPDVLARHLPDHGAPGALARRLGLRNTLWFAWTRRPWRIAARWTLHVVGSSPANAATALGLLDFVRWLPRLPRERRPLPPGVEADLALLDEQKLSSRARSYGRTPIRARRRGIARWA